MKKLQALLSWTWTPFFALLCGALAVVLLTWALVPAEPAHLFGEPRSTSSPLVKPGGTSSLGAVDRVGASRVKTSSAPSPIGAAQRPLKNPLAGIRRADDSSGSDALPTHAQAPTRPSRVRQALPSPAPTPPTEDDAESEEEEEAEEEEAEEEAAPVEEGPEEADDKGDKDADAGSPDPKIDPKQQLLGPGLLKRLPFVQNPR